MDSWVKQTGYPVLQVGADRGADGVQVSLSQERFVYDHLLGEEEPNPEVWQVPVKVGAPGDAESATVMEGKEAVVAVPAPRPSDDWFKVNAGQTGFYRVNYSRDDWQRLAPAISGRELPATDRLGIQNDAYALSRAGLLPVDQFLELAGSYAGED